MTPRSLLIYRLARLLASWQHRSSVEMFTRKTQISRHFFVPSFVNRVGNDDTKSDNSASNIKSTSHRVLLSRRRSLSPLERLSSLLPQGSLTPEVEELRDPDQHHSFNTPTELSVSANIHSVIEETEYPVPNKTGDMENGDQISDQSSLEVKEGIAENLSDSPVHHYMKGEAPLTYGELLLAEYRKKGQVEFRKMFQLLERTRLQSSWGVIPHEEIAGKPAGSFIKTNRGTSLLVRRASLEEYVLLMKRGPAIAYPKEAAAMLLMMDIMEGDCVLEAGSGSGAMSLFLSRAVGTSGRVMSFEVREDHLRRAVLNYNRWRASWELRRRQPWPDNVEFLLADLCAATSVLQGQSFHAVSLDLVHPHLVLPVVTPHLHSGAVCAIYLANITQVIDLLEGLRCLRLPLLCERIMELPSRDWLVAPAFQKDGSYCIRKSPVKQESLVNGGAASEVDRAEQEVEFGGVPYIARPHPEQLSHTAFLVKLRRYV